MTLVDLLRDLFNQQKTDEEIEERRKVVSEALIEDQRQRVRWLRSYVRYGSTGGQSEDAMRKLAQEEEALRRLEEGEEGDFLDALGL